MNGLTNEKLALRHQYHQRRNATAAEHIRSGVAQATGEHFISAITIDEIIFGLRLRKMKNRLLWFEAFVAENCIVLEIDSRIAQRAGGILL